MEPPKVFEPRPERHKVIQGEDADAECPTERGFTGIDCPDCGQRYIVHCLKCMQQCSNCICTMPNILERTKEEIARRMDEAESGIQAPWKKLWTPEDN